MPSKAFSRARREASGMEALLGNIYGTASALLIPLICISIGMTAALLGKKDEGIQRSPVVLGNNLKIRLPDWFVEMQPPIQLLTIVGVGTALALLQVLFLWLFYRTVFRRARLATTQIHQNVLDRCIEHSSSEGITAQLRRAEHLIERDLPTARAGLIAWYRAMPRSALILLGCIVVAFLVDHWLALLAIVIWLLSWKFYRWLEGLDEPQSSEWELPSSREKLVELVQVAPLLARLQPDEGFETLYTSQLKTVMDLQHRRDRKTIQRVPTISLVATLAIGFLFLALGINVLDPTSGLSLSAALLLALSLVGAGSAASRLTKTQQQLASAGDAAANIFGFLDRPTHAVASERLSIGGMTDAIELVEVTLHDGQQNTLLDQVSLRLEPGTVTTLLGTDATSLRALAELLLGFGRPETGKVTIDGMAIADIHPSALGKQVIWVSGDGPIWNGTIEVNLRAAAESVTTSDLADVTRLVGIYEKIQNFEDGFSSIISPSDARFEPEERYALSVARAILAKPAVVIVEEPALPTSTLTDDTCLDALVELSKTGTLIVMLPKRLRSLRMADRVVLISKGRIAGEGKHEQLLASSDFYRHLNYLLFNPYRDIDA